MNDRGPRQAMSHGRIPLAASEACLAVAGIVAAWRQMLPSWLALVLGAFWLLHAVMLWRFMRESARAERHLVLAKEAADQANLTRGAFLSTMSHEIRTPMNAVVGMTGLLRATHLDAQQQEFARAIEDSANALLNIINDVLDFSKIDVGKMDIAVMEFDISEVIEASVDVLALKAREKRVRLISHIDPGLPPRLIGDPGRIRQILLNLIGNALKFTNHGQVSVRGSLVRVADGQCRIRIEVRDSGIGMDAETLQRLFTPFMQADGSVTRKYGGTGLGLSICKRLVDLMGGDIGVHSVPGTGSCFWFELGLPLAARKPVSAPTPANASTGAQVSLLEPQDESAQMIVDYLRSSGVEVIHYQRAQDLLYALPKHGNAPHICIVSTEPAEMPTEQVLNRIRQSNPQIRSIVLDHGTSCDVRADRIGLDSIKLPFRKRHLLEMVLGRSDASQPGSPAAAAPSPVTGAAQAEILLVEDNLMNQKVAIYQLNAIGYTADIAANGNEALDRLATRTYSLILMDCQMPVLDGYETTRRIRCQEKGSHTPIIAMTANAMAGDRELCLDAGMDDYLTKPLLREKLVSTLEKYLPAAPSRHPGKILDEKRLHELFGDDNALRQEMLEMFIEHTEPLMQQLHQVCARQAVPADEAAAIGHRLTGSCLNLGVQALGGLGKDLERAARQGEQEQIRILASQCMAAFEQLRSFIGKKSKEEI